MRARKVKLIDDCSNVMKQYWFLGDTLIGASAVNDAQAASDLTPQVSKGIRYQDLF